MASVYDAVIMESAGSVHGQEMMNWWR